jgi:hypothetical protein
MVNRIQQGLIVNDYLCERSISAPKGGQALLHRRFEAVVNCRIHGVVVRYHLSDTVYSFLC